MPCILQLWICFSALVSSNALDRWNTRCTEVTISASLKSEVFLPCHFNKSFDDETVKWSNSSNESTLLRIKNNGLFYLDSPREGRVSVLPLLFKDGNFSILIRDLELSDFGPYFCELNRECWRVEITERLIEKTVEVNSYKPSLFFFAGAGLFTLLFIVFHRTGLHNRCVRCMRSSKCHSINEEHNEEHDSSNHSSIQQRAFRTPDPNDSTMTTVYYVNQA
ncbi:uncharacterized protein LOC125248536 [Megalobrama amblycephala]|uniref:uncharacterized protein LOC125248536 n=1 Tax=Megalobrama amblycephala TaxID=75352 RepID=UPI002013FD5D|nr:uncharacterized protein LOC125248536 [Megalobrama amblycephala]